MKQRVALFLFGMLAMGMMAGFSGANADTRTFPKPKAGPYRVDWCLIWGAQCGQPAADKFCQNNSYLNATDFDEAVDIGASVPPIATIVQGTGQVCNAPNCDGFSQITCTRPDLPPPPLPPPGPPPGGGGADPGTIYKTFLKPKYHGKRLNFCQEPGSGCGQEAADSYCDAKGYDDAVNFLPSSPMPPGVTRYVGNEMVCIGPVCRAFVKITCERSP